MQRIEPRDAGDCEIAELTPAFQVACADVDVRKDVAGNDEEQVDEGPAPLVDPAHGSAVEITQTARIEDLHVIDGDDAGSHPAQPVQPRQTGDAWLSADSHTVRKLPRHNGGFNGPGLPYG